MVLFQKLFPFIKEQVATLIQQLLSHYQPVFMISVMILLLLTLAIPVHGHTYYQLKM
jgi:hypothetical protein